MYRSGNFIYQHWGLNQYRPMSYPLRFWHLEQPKKTCLRILDLIQNILCNAPVLFINSSCTCKFVKLDNLIAHTGSLLKIYT